ncbi:MAG: translation initiation factor IF-2 N-terminal domain-containing protein, partial [Actinomycetota bacterium]
MPKKIRIYELARELGLSNEECLELCEELKIGVKNHSSSIEDPMADRVRRLADAKGIRREPIVDEAPPAKKTAEKKTPAPATPEPAASEPAAPERAGAAPAASPTTGLRPGSCAAPRRRPLLRACRWPR